MKISLYSLSIIGLVVIFLAITTPGFGAGTNIDELTPLPDGDLRTMVLQQDPSSDISLEIVQVIQLTDGKLIFSITGGPIENLITFAYDIDFDLEQGTYKTTMVPLKDALINPSQVEENDEYQGSSIDEQIILQQSSVSPLAIAPGIYSAEVKLQSKDPALLTLAQTRNYLRWEVFANGSVQWKAITEQCTGYTTPPPFNTHWYVASCPHDNPYYSGGIVYNEHAGAYENSDWGDPNVYTYSSHWIKIGGKNDGHCTYQTTYLDWGEDASLLWGKRIVVSCP